MKTIYEWHEIAIAAFSQIGEKLSSGLINLIGALVVLFIGWLITKFIVFLLRKLLNASRINRLTEKIGSTEWFKNSFKVDVVYIITFFAKWILYLAFIVIAAEIMQWTVISNEITSLFNYLPNLFIAIALFLVGVYVADFIKKALQGILASFKLVGAETISAIAFYLIVIIFIITALNQAKIDTSIITSNLVIIVGGVILTLAIAIGVGSIETVQKLLLTHYTRKKFKVDDSIKVGDIKGIIKTIDATTISIETSDKAEVCMPIKEFTSSKVEFTK